jgi:hypothetical protein
MLGGFDVIPKFKRIFHPSEYEPKWSVVIGAPFLLLVYAYMFLRRLIKK